jgi:hypothetical protein
MRPNLPIPCRPSAAGTLPCAGDRDRSSRRDGWHRGHAPPTGGEISRQPAAFALQASSRRPVGDGIRIETILKRLEEHDRMEAARAAAKGTSCLQHICDTPK